MQDADAVLSNTLNASITQMSSERVAKDAELTTQMSTLQANFDAHEVMLDAKWDDTNYKVDQLPSTFATIADLNTRETQLEELANSKAPEVHFHNEYATKVSIANFITLDDVPKYAAEVHGHQASEISGLDELFMTPAETQAMIDQNKVTLNLEAALFDNFYDKDEVDQKFHVARWRTDQISLFNPTVQGIVLPIVSLAVNEIEVSLGSVRAEEIEKDNAVRSLIASTRAEIEVSIGNTNSTVEANRVSAELSSITLQGNIDQARADATASIASSQSHVLTELASVRAEVLAETSSNDVDVAALQGRATSLETRATDLEAKDTSLDSDISGLQGQIDTTNLNVSQTLVDAKAYTDTEINELLNGAGDAYNTLKELQDHITSNESGAAEALAAEVNGLQTQIDGNDLDITAVQNRATALESSVGLLQSKDTSLDNDITGLQNQITGNDADITSLQTRATNVEGRATALETRATALEAQDVTFQSNLDTLQTTYNNLVASNNSLTAAYQGLLDRVETLENTAYAQAGYIFP
jgi:chromosome segregation ATPase